MSEILTETTMSLDYGTSAKKKLLVLQGYIEAEDAAYQIKRNNIFVINSYSQKNEIKKVNSISKPKGDIELKNIQYRITDKRYIGRKQINGQIITVYAKTQKECADKLKQKLKEINSLNFTKAISRKYIFKDLYMQWYNQEKAPFISKGAKSDILLVFNKLEKFHELDIRKITKQSLTTFFLGMEENRTKEKTRLYLNACLNYYFNEGIIKVNPCANVKVKKSNAKKIAFTYEQQITILEYLKDKPLKTIILLYLVTGLRKNELNFQSIEKDIDFDNRILKAVNLKGRNQVKRYKQIKLSSKTISMIMNNIDIIHSYTAESAYREFAEFLKELHIKGSIVNCRHTFATNCFYLDKPELVISREMGHSKSQITKDIYTDIDYHLSKEKIVKLYNNLYNQN